MGSAMGSYTGGALSETSGILLLVTTFGCCATCMLRSP